MKYGKRNLGTITGGGGKKKKKKGEGEGGGGGGEDPKQSLTRAEDLTNLIYSLIYGP